MRVALFGGAFDPPHVGHLLVTAYVLATEEVDRVWLMPAYAHAFDKKMSPFPHRLEMCLILANLFRKGVDATSVESEIGGKGYTVDTIRFLQARYPSFQFHLVIGSDILAETHAWKDFDAIEKLAPPIVVPRAGHPHPRAAGKPAMPDVSSTEVRRRLVAGEDVSHLVPREIRAYIEAAGLYR
ncbi:MAG TPA: nicotinate (nicotinamide) nucleotide adenylyltransferase [Fredinandcohnia sp.]|nr:nicotinate (nicotinamide) nucleotide adenylyltransferase [Fredinandcohnia sp.]